MSDLTMIRMKQNDQKIERAKINLDGVKLEVEINRLRFEAGIIDVDTYAERLTNLRDESHRLIDDMYDIW